PIHFRTRTGVPFANLKKAVSVLDVTDPAHEVPVTPSAKPRKTEAGEIEEEEGDPPSFSLDELGYSLHPAHNYAILIDASLASEDAQTLGYTWMAVVEYWHKAA